jgi:predicted aspartyl protease
LAIVVASTVLRADEKATPSHAGVLEEFPIGDELVLVPVRLGDRHFSFALDTGASYSSLDTRHASGLGKALRRVNVATTESKMVVTEFAVPALSVGRLKPSPDTRVFGVDLTELRQAADEPIDGMIGMGFLRRYILQFDFDNQRVRFMQSLPAEPGTPIPIRLDGGRSVNIPRVEIGIGVSSSPVFLIDTGSNGSLAVNRGLFDELDNAGRVDFLSDVLVSDMAGKTASRQGRLDHFTLGEHAHRGLILYRTHGSCRIGLRYLQRFIVTFDFPKRTMYLKRGKNFDRTEEWDLSGIHARRVNGDAVIDAVDPDSPAAGAGVQPRDVIVQVGDQPAAEVPLARLRALLREDGGSVKLTIRRDEMRETVTLKLREFRTPHNRPTADSPRSQSE